MRPGAGVELREVAAEELAGARLADGDAARAVAELEELVRAAPLRERRWTLLILGLYRSGRQGDALAAVRRIRALLADELGVDPGPELQDLERQVLAHDPRLDLPEPAPRIGDRAGMRRPVTSFLGRDAELKLVTEHLAGQGLVTLIGPAHPVPCARQIAGPPQRRTFLVIAAICSTSPRSGDIRPTEG